MPQPRALTPDQEQLAWQLWLQRVPQTQIAERLGCHRNRISAWITRILRELADARRDALEDAREQALATLDAIQAEAWSRLAAAKPTSNVSAAYLSTIIEATRLQARILGLERLGIDLRGAALLRVDSLLDETVPVVLPGGLTQPATALEDAQHGRP